MITYYSIEDVATFDEMSGQPQNYI
jgi:hypothetical protein